MQLNFPFSTNIDIYDIRNFIVHDGNRNVFDFITSSLMLNNNIYLLTGPKKSGKTYLSRIWNKLNKANFIDNNIFKLTENEYMTHIQNYITLNSKYILEDIELIDIKEEYLLYLINAINEKNALLLITSKKYINDFNFEISDLNSRFHNIINFILKDLNEDSKQKIILKLLNDRQISIESNSLEYISRKISGDYNIIFSFVNNVESLIQSNKIKRITINNIKHLI